MKIAIPADEQKMEGNVCISFGRTPYFLIFDTEAGTGTFMVNEAAQSQGGAGIQAAQAVVDSGAQVLLTPRCGENAAKVLNGANVRIHRSIEGSLTENIEAFKAGQLPLLEEIHPGYHGH